MADWWRCADSQPLDLSGYFLETALAPPPDRGEQAAGSVTLGLIRDLWQVYSANNC